MKFKVAKTREDAHFPTKKHPGDAGWDIYIPGKPEDGWGFYCLGNSYIVIDTGIKIEFPTGYRMRIVPKSRNNYLIGAGLIESNYQGSILVKVVNTSKDSIFIEYGTAIAQIIFELDPETEMEEVSLEEIHQVPTSRGETGGIVEQINGAF